MMIGWVQPGTSRGTFLQMIGSRKMVPPRMLRMVPLGLRHICLRPNSFTRPSSGVMVAHFTATPYFLVAWAASTVTWSLVWSRCSTPMSKYLRSMSRYGRISVWRIFCQMMRVISSPSISTTGFFTLILLATEEAPNGGGKEDSLGVRGNACRAGRIMPPLGSPAPSRLAEAVMRRFLLAAVGVAVVALGLCGAD